MIETEGKIKRWGRSFGVIIPMDLVKSANLSENEEIEISIKKKRNPLRKHFGTFKFSKSTKEILEEGDKESWDE